MTARVARVTDVVSARDLAGRLVPSPLVRSAVHGDRTILLDLRRERYYSLDEVGTRVWALLKDGADVPAIVARLGEEYDAPRKRLQADVSEVLRYLYGLQVIVPADGKQNGGRPARGKGPAWSHPRPVDHYTYRRA